MLADISANLSQCFFLCLSNKYLLTVRGLAMWCIFSPKDNMKHEPGTSHKYSCEALQTTYLPCGQAVCQADVGYSYIKLQIANKLITRQPMS
jgi:hypothetical protein